MLTTLNLKVGSILHDMELNIDHRVIYMNKDYFVTILINGIKEKTEINEWHIQTLQHFVNKKQIAVREPKFDKVFDFDSLPEKTKEIYLRNKDIVETVGDIYFVETSFIFLFDYQPLPFTISIASKSLLTDFF